MKQVVCLYWTNSTKLVCGSLSRISINLNPHVCHWQKIWKGKLTLHWPVVNGPATCSIRILKRIANVVLYATLEYMLAVETHYGQAQMYGPNYLLLYRRDCTSGTPGTLPLHQQPGRTTAGRTRTEQQVDGPRSDPTSIGLLSHCFATLPEGAGPGFGHMLVENFRSLWMLGTLGSI